MASNPFNFFNFLSGQKTNQEEIEKVPVETSDLPIGSKAVSDPKGFDLEGWKFLNSKSKSLSLADFKKLCKSLYLEEEIADFIDIQVRVNPIVSKAYTDHLSLSDTEIVVEAKIQGKSEEESQAIYKQFEEQIPAFYPDCNSVRDVSKFRLGNLIRYGVFSSQKIYTEFSQELEEIRILPAWNLFWRNNDASWIPYQKTKAGEIDISPDGFLYAPLFPIVNDKGKFFLPPLLAGIAQIPVYELFLQSLENIAVNMGFHKMLKLVSDADTLKVLQAPGIPPIQVYNKKTKKTEEVPVHQYISMVSDSFKEGISNNLKVGVLPNPFGLKTEEGDRFDPPSDLTQFKNLLTTDIVLGLKSYLTVLGIPSGENLTTLSNTQKQSYKNLIETFQSTNLSIHKHDFVGWLNSKKMLLENWNAYHQPPSFDTLKETEEARSLKLTNDQKEKMLKEGTLDSNTIESEEPDDQSTRTTEPESEESQQASS